ncbi:MAG: Up-regulated during septation-domain-containing protein [Benjaminiella poitrasii]|nr:MAG: Up-regulated during septation-domain-containing protein [Benjaminiella poitrasii]
MSMLRDSCSPSPPTRSPFRVRDSQLAKMQNSKQAERWSFTAELNNMWNMKLIDNRGSKHHHYGTMPSSSSSKATANQLLTQLLISQAMLDSSDYRTLSFENVDKFKKELIDIHAHITHLSRNIKLEARIKNISKALENVNLKNSRHSILYLQNEHQQHDQRLKHMLKQLEQLKNREIELKRALLEHTAAILNKGLHNKTKLSTKNTSSYNEDGRQHILILESQLLQMTKQINFIYMQRVKPTPSNLSTNTIQKLIQLETHLFQFRNQQKDNHFNSSEKGNDENKQLLLNIEIQKDSFISRLIDMDHATTRLLTQINHHPQRQIALKMELLQFKSESIEMQIWKKKRQRDEDIDHISKLNLTNLNPNHILRYQGQLDEQSKYYETEIKQQSAVLQRNKRLYEQLEKNCDRLKNERSHLEQVVKEKSRALDAKDIKLTQLNNEIRNPRSNNFDTKKNDDHLKIKKIKQDIESRESRWTTHITQMEDKFDVLLDKFDRLTNTAIEFDSHRMKYDKKIEVLNTTIHQLELELVNEKVKKIGYGNLNEPPTTVSLRKEFRMLVADVKKSHQIRMEQEFEEMRRLRTQLEELKQNNNIIPCKKQNSIAIQTNDIN